ncbi:hypothetical protein LR48_Vigan03g191400 [Vigna angularis]|uniref:Uncharacterized protein n=1 Tax=Phaseolus angularis TaxID=3914 RepID=A0A0L9U7A8_PHAAN|nr:hypothetical protein LR48_Vigan03g191400 [Vigna angularis]
MWKGLTLEEEIVGNPSVSPSPTLDRNEKVEHYIKMKDPLTHCLKVLGNLLLDRPNSGSSNEYNDPFKMNDG